MVKVSVIIPVYNVAEYLPKCLDTVIAQTHSNLEIIVVDDGSSDGSSFICDEYAAKDSRIIVVHKENGGVSSARNVGLDIASGEWIGWVDPDDWVELDMFEYLVENTSAFDADIVVCGRQLEYPDRSEAYTFEQQILMDRETAISVLLENEIMRNYLWDKLWKRSLFSDIRFPEGRTYEDIAVLHRLFERAECVCCLPQIKYHYWQRDNGIVNNISLKNRINYYLAAEQRYSEMKDEWPQFRGLLEGQCVAAAIGIWASYLKNTRAVRERYYNQIKEISGFAKAHYRQALNNMSLGPTGRLVVRVIPYTNTWAFVLALLLSKIYNMKHGREL